MEKQTEKQEMDAKTAYGLFLGVQKSAEARRTLDIEDLQKSTATQVREVQDGQHDQYEKTIQYDLRNTYGNNPFLFQVALTLPLADMHLKRLLVVAPTGSGKTTVYSMMIENHRKEDKKSVIVRRSGRDFESQFVNLLTERNGLNEVISLVKDTSFANIGPKTKIALGMQVLKKLKSDNKNAWSDIKKSFDFYTPQKSNELSDKYLSYVRKTIKDMFSEYNNEGVIKLNFHSADTKSVDKRLTFETFTSVAQMHEKKQDYFHDKSFFVDEVHDLFMNSNRNGRQRREQFLKLLASGNFDRLVGLTATPGGDNLKIFAQLVDLFSNSDNVQKLEDEVANLSSAIKLKQGDVCLRNARGVVPTAATYGMTEAQEEIIRKRLQSNKVGVVMFAEGANIKEVYPTLLPSQGNMTNRYDEVRYVNVNADQSFDSKRFEWKRNSVTSYYRFRDDPKSRENRSILSELVAHLEATISEFCSQTLEKGTCKIAIYMREKASARRVFERMAKMKYFETFNIYSMETPQANGGGARKLKNGDLSKDVRGIIDEFNDDREDCLIISNSTHCGQSLTLKGVRLLIKIGIFDALDETQVNGRVRRIGTHAYLEDKSEQNVRRIVLIPKVDEKHSTCDQILYHILNKSREYQETLFRVLWNVSITRPAFKELHPDFCSSNSSTGLCGASRIPLDTKLFTTTSGSDGMFDKEEDDAAEPEYYNDEDTKEPSFEVQQFSRADLSHDVISELNKHYDAFCNRDRELVVNNEDFVFFLNSAEVILTIRNADTDLLHGFAFFEKRKGDVSSRNMQVGRYDTFQQRLKNDATLTALKDDENYYDTGIYENLGKAKAKTRPAPPELEAAFKKYIEKTKNEHRYDTLDYFVLDREDIKNPPEGKVKLQNGLVVQNAPDIVQTHFSDMITPAVLKHRYLMEKPMTQKRSRNIEIDPRTAELKKKDVWELTLICTRAKGTMTEEEADAEELSSVPINFSMKHPRKLVRKPGVELIKFFVNHHIGDMLALCSVHQAQKFYEHQNFTNLGTDGSDSEMRWYMKEMLAE